MDQYHPVTNNKIVVNYMHLQSSPTLRPPNSGAEFTGDRVTKGTTLLGYVGNTGNVQGTALLHFEVSNTGKTFPQSYAGTDNPILYFPNISFTGDTTVRSNSTTSFSTRQDDLGLYIIDISLIDQVGIKKVDQWLSGVVKQNTQKQYTVNDFRDYFNINDTEFRKIVTDKKLDDLYDVEK